MRATLCIKGPILDIRRSPKGYIHSFAVGKKVIDVFSKENGHQIGEVVEMDVSTTDKQWFDMMFKRRPMEENKTNKQSK